MPLQFSALPKSPAWLTLQDHYQHTNRQHMREQFAQEPERFKQFSLSTSGLTLDYSKNRINQDTLALLEQLAVQQKLPEAIEALFAGKIINKSEQRPALHTALRDFSHSTIEVDGKNIIPQIHQSLDHMEQFCWQIRRKQWRGFSNKPFTDVVSIGIGGSFLGPKLASAALKPYWDGQINCHYLANIDGSHITEILSDLNPDTTLFIVQSKSFDTQETLKNALGCRHWFLHNGGSIDDLDKHFAAVTAEPQKAIEFGIAEKNIFPMWDWVGGRYSLWSAIGLPLAITIGIDNFRDLLRGAFAMDQHFKSAPLQQNMPVIMGLLGIWYINFYHKHSHAILPYDHYLRGLPAHLQQLDMESNGKSINQYNESLQFNTGPIIWGGAGANGQHAYHQLLHQGSHFSPCDFIVPLRSHNPIDDFHKLLFSNCLSQSQALMQGKTEDEAMQELLDQGLDKTQAKLLAPQKAIPGNRPSNTLLFNKANPHTIGALIALYEHKVFVQGAIWGINSFDQWGVELGKHLGNNVLKQLNSSHLVDDFDSSTNGLINAFRNMNYSP